MSEFLTVIQQSVPDLEAAETLRELSPWAYVIVIFACVVAGVFYRLYVKEKEKRDLLEKEFRVFMSDSLTRQIQVSKDVIDLVENNKTSVNDALATFHNSDVKLESLMTEIRNQLTSIESHITRINR
jgi:hypothetical protein